MPTKPLEFRLRVVLSADGKSYVPEVTPLEFDPIEYYSEKSCSRLGIDPADWKDTMRRLRVPVTKIRRGLHLAKASLVRKAIEEKRKKDAELKARPAPKDDIDELLAKMGVYRKQST